MGRRPREFYSGQIYHVIGRGNDGQDLFLDDWHFQKFLSVLGGAKARFKFRIFAYCLMTNHFHLLLQQSGPSLSKAIHSILNRYAHWFNAKHERRGHLFQDRFRALLCRDDAYFVELLRYIHLNPVRAGLVDEPIGWTWTGHREMIRSGSIIDREFPLSFFGETAGSAVQEYERFLQIQTDFAPDELGESIGTINEGASVEEPPPKGVGGTPQKLALEVSRLHRISLEALLGRGRMRSLTVARREFVRLCLDSGVSPREIQDYLGCSPAYISKVAGLVFS